jgi:hypothetical protein
MPAKNLKIRPAYRKQGPAALTNNTQDNFNKIHANNIVKRSGFAFTAQEILFHEKIKEPAATLL